MLIKDAQTEDKSAIYKLWKQAYPYLELNYLNFYFKHKFDQDVSLVLEKDEHIVSCLQMQHHTIRLFQHRLSVSYLLYIATDEAYRRKGYMTRLMDEILDQASHNHLVTFVKAYYPEVLETFGFKKIAYRKQYCVDPSQVKACALTHVETTLHAEELSKVYQAFVQHFDGYFERSTYDMKLLMEQCFQSQKQMIGYRGDYQLEGYIIYQRKEHYIYVEEAIYLHSRALEEMLNAIIQDDEILIVEVSEMESLEALFPNATVKNQVYMMMKIHQVDLFEKLYQMSEEAFYQKITNEKQSIWVHIDD